MPKQAAAAREPDELAALHREERDIESRLQDLLDAQAEALVTGLTGSQEDDVLSTGSSTPTVSTPYDRNGSRRESLRSDGGNAFVRQQGLKPQRRNLNLNGSRKGIHKAMQRLAMIKVAEAEIYARDLDKNQAVLRQILAWETKQSRLEDKIDMIKKSDTGLERQALLGEADKLEQEIGQLEEKLRHMKARHKELLDEAAAVENRVQAKLSSYRFALENLHSDVNNFLTSATKPGLIGSRNSSVGGSFFKLPPNRRTLELAKEQWIHQRDAAEDECKRIEVDRAALEEGAVMWNGVLSAVSKFEAELKKAMTQPPPSPSLLPSLSSGSKAKGKQKATESNSESGHSNPEDILVQMDAVMAHLSHDLSVAESRNWNLLVCCIGAELDAFKQGRNMFREAMGLPLDDESAESGESAANDGDVESNATSKSTRSGALSRESYHDGYRDDDDHGYRDEEGQEMEDTARAWNIERESKLEKENQGKLLDASASEDETDPAGLLIEG